MAASAYQFRRSVANRVSPSAISGWNERIDLYDRDPASGFEAKVFQSGNQIVIAFTGTDELQDWLSNGAGVVGQVSPHLQRAVALYASVVAAHGTAQISFTGHSLGGGLASLMGVFFDRPAVSFAQAPFRAAAKEDVRDALLATLGTDPAVQAIRATLSAFTSQSFSEREKRVTDYSVPGEVLSLPGVRSFRIGAQNWLPDVSSGLLPDTLHDASLHVVLSDREGPFAQAAAALPRLVSLLFDGSLFAFRNDRSDRNLLDHLIRHEYGVPGSVQPTGMLRHFAADMQRIGRAGSLAVGDLSFNKALITLGMQSYYDQATGFQRELFTELAAGLALDGGALRSSAATYKAGAFFSEYFTAAEQAFKYSSEEAQSVRGALLTLGPIYDRWYFATRPDTAFVASAGNTNNLMVGADAADTLTGGIGGDLLVGGRGRDRLDGGDGMDTLYGGAGNDMLRGGAQSDRLWGGDNNDTYLLGETGLDEINDPFGQNRIIYQDRGVGAFFKVGNAWELDGLRATLSGTDLTLSRTDGLGDVAVIIGWQPGQFGIQLRDAPVNPTTTYPLTGDYELLDTDLAEPGIQTRTDPFGNLERDPRIEVRGRSDEFYDSPANDLIDGKEGTDTLLALAGGADRLIGGDGDDYIVAGSGADLLEGGNDRDRLFGQADADQIFGGTITSIEGAIAAGRTGSGTNVWQDLLSGGAGDDLVIGGSERDLLAGGAGSDVMIGGVGADHFESDLDVTDATTVWQVIDTFDTATGLYTYSFQGMSSAQAAGGNDTVYAGRGDDVARLGGGDDVAYGEDGADKLWGEGGADMLFGGAGDDLLTGDNGASQLPLAQHGEDYIDGGPGKDTIAGGGAGDTIFGGADDDYISADELSFAFAGDDFVDGGSGEDRIWGGAGADSLFGGSGVDRIYGDFIQAQLDSQYHGVDVIDGGDDGDFLFGMGGADTLYGGAGDDYIRGDDDGIAQGMQGGDSLFGGAGRDTIVGDGGDDYIDGGAEDDELDGGAGNDRYVVRAGDGRDTIYEERAGNTLVMIGGQLPHFAGAGARGKWASGEPAAAWLSVQGTVAEGQFFLLEVDDQTSVLIANGPQGVISEFEINGAAMSARRMMAEALRDSLSVVASDPSGQVLYGGRGTDYLQGAAGGDTLYGAGGPDGLDGHGGNDTILGEGGNDSLGGGDGDDSLEGGEGEDTLSGDGGSFLGSDSLRGGAGRDLLMGGLGADSYLFDAGDGYDTILEINQASGVGVDRLVFGPGVTPSQVSLYRVHDGWGFEDLLVVVADTGDQVFVKDFFDTTYADRALEEIAFDGGVAWNQTELLANVIEMGASTVFEGTVGDDTFFFDSWYDWVSSGGTGMDTIVTPYGVSINMTWDVENITLDGVLSVDATGNGNANVIRGNSGSNTIRGYGGADQLYGGAGDDLYAFGYEDDYYVAMSSMVFELPDGGYDNVTTYNGGTLPENVEAARLSDYWSDPRDLVGNSLDNVLMGRLNPVHIVNGQGRIVDRDRLDGGAGADTLIGYSGVTFVIDNPGDIIVFRTNASGRNTSVEASVDHRLVSGIQDLVLTGTAAITGIGNELSNTLDGTWNSASNLLVGRGGNDKYILGAGDTLFERAGEGVDEVEFAYRANPFGVSDYFGSDPIFASIESLTLGLYIGAARLFGNDADNKLTANNENSDLYGGLGADQLIGGAYANVLDGGGGADYMRGYGGNDTYVVDETGDVVEESRQTDGIDTVQSFISYALGQWVDNITLLGTTATTATGGPLANVLNGALNPAANVLVGGTGNDVYIVDGADQVVESADEGVDEMQGAVSISLAANVENGRLSGSAAATLTGNALDNLLYGNAANNTLIGGDGNDQLFFGSGVDVLDGGNGNDTYWFTSWDTGTLQISSTDQTVGKLDVVRWDTYASYVYLRRTNDDLILEQIYSGDIVRVVNFFGAVTPSRIEEFRFYNDVVWTGQNVASRVFTGTAGADTITGTVDGDTILGLGGADVLDGGEGDNWIEGGDGDDTITAGLGWNRFFGGQGNDTYIVHFGVVTEYSNEGFDTMRSSRDASMQENVERLELIGTDAINGTGNAGANEMIGNSVANTLQGYEGDDLLDGGGGSDTMVGGPGNDTYVSDVAGDIITENPDEGIDTVRSAVTRTLGNNLENLTLTGTSAINGTGNALDNVLIGNSAANTLNGGAGADSLRGGAGDDTYVIDASDTVIENSNEGNDLVQTATSYALPVNVERLTLTGTASVNATGNDLNNTLTGNSGANILDGGAGADSMSGGTGNDTYYVDNTGDTVTESSSTGGTDTVFASVTFTLGSNVERLTLTGAANVNATGNTLANVLTGNSGANAISGGTGADTMVGGAGNDTYTVDNTGDVVTELAGEGTDTINSSVTYAAGANVENLTLTGTATINATGNALANVLTGNSANNTLTGGDGDDYLDGLGGTDAMIGGLGNDTFVVAQTTDVTTENAAQGTDTVRAGITWTLANNVENLILTGTTAINGTGNTLDNALTGNSAVNALVGNAGADTLDGAGGADTLTGGVGNDAYRLARGYGADTVVENDATAGNNDIAQFLAGVVREQVWFLRAGNNLEASIIGTSDKLIVKDWYLGTQYRTEQFKTTDDARTLLAANVQNLVNAMAAFSAPAAGQTTLPPAYQSALLPVIAANWT
jgi:Ca2+-binding RTX toxin-like protein